MYRVLCVGAALAVLLVTQTAQAKNHQWKFTEVFSTADGTVQFVEMAISDPTGTAEFLLMGVLLESNANLYVFPNHLPFVNTFERSILIATPAFAALPDAPTPDFLIPPNFFDPADDVLLYRDATDVIVLPPGAVPVDGILSYARDGSTGVNSPTNFAGVVGSVDASMPCDDGLDNDGDGLIDLADPGCDLGPTDFSERSDALPCDDGVDNDLDGRRDFDPVTFANPGDENTLPSGQGDPVCNNPLFFRENSLCQNGVHNDGDGKMDYDAGLSWNGFADPAGPDPECVGKPWKNREKSGNCGLGYELALGMAGLMWLRRRRERVAA